MTIPNPFHTTDSYSTLRRRWWERFAAVNAIYEKQIRRILTTGADSAERKILNLGQKSTFSAGVRSAQIRLAVNEMRTELKDIFNEITPIIRKGSQHAAAVAVDGLSETDRDYLAAAFSETGAMESLIKHERSSAMLSVQHAISRVTKTDQPLSARVYKSRALANHWIQRDVTIGILRGDSAQEIAKTVRRHIRPNTPGGVSYAAMRLARTEINNAFHATTITLSQDRPWIDHMAWNLSNRHEIDPNKPEICEVYASKHWPVDGVPAKPHPQCRCFISPVLESFDVFMRHLAAGQYRDWMENAA